MIPSKDNPSLFSIIILYWRSAQHIQHCLDSLDQQTFRDFEVVLIDNASPELPPAGILARYPNLILRYFPQEKNLGFAGGNNLGASLSMGQYLVLLNSDAFPQPDWLEEISKAIRRYPNHVLASRIIMANEPDRLDSEGDVYHLSGLAWHRSYKQLATKTLASEGLVFSATGAAAVYPKAAFTEVGGFDEDLFAFYEDIDLGFRLRLAGYECTYIPTAVARHVGSGSTGQGSELAAYYNQRNMIWVFIKNFPGWRFLASMPYHMLVNILLVVNAAFHGRGRIYLKAKVDAVKGLKSVLRKRGAVQKCRKIDASAVVKQMNLNVFAPIRSASRNRSD